MKILFSPSEGKKLPCQSSVLSLNHQLIFEKYLQTLRSSSIEKVSKLMGYSKTEETCKVLSLIEEQRSAEAISLYDGVAYDALGFETLDVMEQEFLREHLYICSNLFGFVRADEILPFYKLKQGERFDGFESRVVFAEQKEKMDEILKDEFVLDLRAEFYKKLYQIPCYYYDFEFYKNGKKVSHYAKYYRGIVAREVAKDGRVDKIEERLEQYGLSSLQSKNQKNCTILAFCVD